MKFSCLFILLLGPLCFLNAQSPYTQVQFDHWEEADVVFGSAVDYNDQQVDLLIDLYKPAGDANCLRPVILMIHGGAFIAGSRKDPEIVAICRQMAQRGYLAVSLEYRLGNHKRSGYTPYAICNVDPCIYVADSTEVYRSVFRAVQDVKGALRFLASRQEQDSSDMENVFVGGVSAGGYIAMHSALWDQPDEKPDAAFELPGLPVPDPDLTICYAGDPALDRPDLGDLPGTIFPDQTTPAVRGVANFFGGVFGNINGNEDFPPLYLYHQTNDLIVDCWVRRPFGGMYQFCINPLNLCQPLYNAYPTSYGSCAIESYLESLSVAAPPYLADIVDSGPVGGLACLANPPGHSILNLPLRCKNMAAFFAPLISENGNDPTMNCALVSSKEYPKQQWEVHPNPFAGSIRLRGPSSYEGTVELQLFSVRGRLRAQASLSCIAGSLEWNIRQQLPPGCYWLRLQTRQEASTIQLILQASE